MQIKLKFILFFAGLIFAMKALPQSDISMSTNWYNRANYNPATITSICLQMPVNNG
jgi:hypothetical protein